MITLPEELLLLADGTDPQTPQRVSRPTAFGLAAAALADLVLRHKVSESLGRLRVEDASPTGEPALDLALAALAAHRGPSASIERWIRALARSPEKLREAAGDRLAERGLVHRREIHPFGLRRVEYVGRDPAVFQALRTRVHAVVAGGGTDRELVLARMVDGARLLGAVYDSAPECEAAHRALVARAPEQPIGDALHLITTPPPGLRAA